MDKNEIIGDYDTKKVSIRFAGENNKVTFGNRFQSDKLNITFEGDNGYIEFGLGCYINANIRLGSGCSMIIGERLLSRSHNSYFIGEETSITIGNDCMFSGNIIFRTDDSHAIYDVTSGERVNLSKSIEIGNHVWVGEECRILKNTRIRDGSVIGMGTFLSNCVIANNTVVAGHPWRYIKYNIAWEKPYLGGDVFKKGLVKSKYWNITTFCD